MTLKQSLAIRRSTLEARDNILQEIRRFFHNGGYLEVETPHRIPFPSPEAYIDPIPSNGWFLHTSPELCMKRLLAAGCERIIQICHCWRSDERGSLHLPEFTMLEWYRSDCSYLSMMEECESFVRNMAKSFGKSEQLSFRENRIDLSLPWERITVRDAFQRYGGMTMEQALSQDTFDDIMVRDIEPQLGQTKPVFIYDYPAERGALARRKLTDPTVAERFELYIGGLELANAFTELTDQYEQRDRFLAEQDNRRSMGKSIYPLPEKFLAELASMPPSAGIALGIDRFIMVLLDKNQIDDVVAFVPEDL
jgi:lysyl-tRNA synthetase class 2